MPTTQAPDWAVPGANAYILQDTMVAGVGSYLTAYPVKVVSVTATQIRVTDPSGNGKPLVFRVADLTRRGTAGRHGQDDMLVSRYDPRARHALLAADAYERMGRAEARVRKHYTDLNVSRARISGDLAGAIEHNIDRLTKIADAATDAIAVLRGIQRDAA